MKANTKQVDFEGQTYTLKLSTAASRIAKLQHDREVDIQELDRDPLGMPATLVWLAMLTYHPEVTEKEAMFLLAKADNEAEIVTWAVKQFRATMDELGKHLAGVAEDG
jgi:hypothetical protein